MRASGERIVVQSFPRSDTAIMSAAYRLRHDTQARAERDGIGSRIRLVPGQHAKEYVHAH
jgi:hypothetical protein